MKLLFDKSGQDLIEYMLLTAFIALTTWGGVSVLGNAIRDSYPRENQAIQDLWETPDPIKEK